MKLYDGSENILMPETIKEMHKIHWHDKLTSVKYGSFGIFNFDNENWVGHGGRAQVIDLSFI